MDHLVFNHSEQFIHGTLGISNERAEELGKECDLAIWELSKPADHDGYDEMQLLEKFLELAKNSIEQIWLTWQAAVYAEQNMRH